MTLTKVNLCALDNLAGLINKAVSVCLSECVSGGSAHIIFSISLSIYHNIVPSFSRCTAKAGKEREKEVKTEDYGKVE